MTKAELEKLRDIQKEIKIIQGEISATSAEYTTDKVTGSMSTYPYTRRSFTIEGYDYERYYARLKRLEKRLKRKLDELMNEREKIEEYIESIDNATTRMILRLRHINGMGWEQIGYEIGYSARHVRRLYSEYIRKALD